MQATLQILTHPGGVAEGCAVARRPAAQVNQVEPPATNEHQENHSGTNFFK